MNNFLVIIWHGVKKSLESWRYKLLFAATFIIFFVLFILLPIAAEPGTVEDVPYAARWVLGFLTPQDYAIIILLSLLYALFIPMQVYVIRQKKKFKGIGTAVGGGIGTLFAGIAGTAFCASCLAPLFAFLGIGFGGVIFVLEYRYYFVIGIALLMLLSIYLIARKIRNSCDTC